MYNIKSMYGYLDESGAPGKANNYNDFLIVSMVVFPDQVSAEKCSDSIVSVKSQNVLTTLSAVVNCSCHSMQP